MLDAYGIYGADSDEEAEIMAAMDMFSESKLALPPLRIYVHDGMDECGGNLGLFSRGGDMHRVDVCMPHVGLIRHELAHAWEYHNVDDSTRQAFMDRAGIDGWNDPEQPHPTRGVERAAFIIAWGSESQPIQMISGGHYAEDLARYELLIGSPSPRISHWGDTPSAARPANVDAMRLAAAASQPEALRS